MKKTILLISVLISSACYQASARNGKDTLRGFLAADFGGGYIFSNNTALSNWATGMGMSGFPVCGTPDDFNYGIYAMFRKVMVGIGEDISGQGNELEIRADSYVGYQLYRNRRWSVVPCVKFSFNAESFNNYNNTMGINNVAWRYEPLLKLLYVPKPRKKLNPSTHWGCTPGGKSKMNNEFFIGLEAGTGLWLKGQTWYFSDKNVQSVQVTAPNLANQSLILRVSIGVLELYD